MTSTNDQSSQNTQASPASQSNLSNLSNQASQSNPGKPQKKLNLQYLVTLAMLTAITIVFVFSPLAGIRLGLFYIAFVALPIGVGAVLLGRFAGLFLGGVFGVCSLIQAFSGVDLGTIFVGISPLRTVLVCLLPRLLAGGLAGLVHALLSGTRRIKVKPPLRIALTLLTAPIANTILFLGAIALLFHASFLELLWPVLGAILLTNALPEAAASLILGMPICLAGQKILRQIQRAA